MKRVIKSTLGYLIKLDVGPEHVTPYFAQSRVDAIVFTKPEFVASVMAILTAKTVPDWDYLKCEEITLVNFVLRWKIGAHTYCGRLNPWRLEGATRFKSYNDAKGVLRGQRELLVQDPDGYLLRFHSVIGTRKVQPQP